MTSARIERAALTVLVVLSLLLLVVVVRPLAIPLFMGAVLAGAFFPWTRLLGRRLGHRRYLAAGLMTVAVLLLIVVPLATLAVSVGREVVAGVAYVKETLRSQGFEGLVDDLPAPLRSLVRTVIAQFPQGEGPMQVAASQRGRAAATMGGLVTATFHLTVQAALMLVALFFFLGDGAELVAWLEDVAPLPKSHTRELLSEFRQVSVAVMVSAVGTAAAGAAMALVGYLLARVPHPFFFGMVTFFLALVPAVGAVAVILCAAALLFVTAHPTAALFLGAWAALVGLVDHLVKPYLIRGSLAIHGGAVFFALLGGLEAFGPVGLLAGPLILAFFLAVVRITQREYPQPG